MVVVKCMRIEEVEIELDFLKFWKMSDVVLVVEDEKFYVYCNVFVLWLFVFEKMFILNFREKSKGEIWLFGK